MTMIPFKLRKPIYLNKIQQEINEILKRITVYKYYIQDLQYTKPKNSESSKIV